jgi:hypothetical protein
MRSLVLPSLAVALLASTAHADELAASEVKPASAGETTPRFAIAVNFPYGWLGGKSLAGSFYAGVTDHLAIRANVASYEAGSSATGGLFAGEAEYSGRTLDLGVGAIHYSNGLWDGFTMEGGVLRRARDVRVTDQYAAAYTTSTDTATYGVRALFGWSFLIKNRVFIAAAVGGSAGVERGTETTENERGEMKTSQDVDRSDISFEGYVRFGAAF